MKKYLLLLTLSIFVAQANESILFFKTSPKNRLLCRASYNTYKIIHQHNASLVNINGNNFFKLKDENLYLTITGCKPITAREGIVF